MSLDALPMKVTSALILAVLCAFLTCCTSQEDMDYFWNGPAGGQQRSYNQPYTTPTYTPPLDYRTEVQSSDQRARNYRQELDRGNYGAQY